MNIDLFREAVAVLGLTIFFVGLMVVMFLVIAVLGTLQ